MYRVDFASLPWTHVRPGVRCKTHREGTRLLRLVEFSTSDGDPHWCEAGHIGYVLNGGLTIDFTGTVLEFKTGDGLFIPRGRSMPITACSSRREPFCSWSRTRSNLRVDGSHRAL